MKKIEALDFCWCSDSYYDCINVEWDYDDVCYYLKDPEDCKSCLKQRLIEIRVKLKEIRENEKKS